MENRTSKKSKFKFLDTHLFDAFLAASETQNFTQAAKQIHMTQAGVSQHIAKLEHQLNHRLFDRHGKRVELTLLGERLVAYIEEYKRMQYKFLDEIERFQKMNNEVVRLGIPKRLMQHDCVIDLLDKINHRGQFTIDIELASTEEIVDKLLMGEISAGFLSSTRLPDRINYQKFCREELIFAASNQLEVKECKSFIKYPGSDEIYSCWFKQEEQSGCKRPPLIQSSRIRKASDAIEFVVDGTGNAIFPKHMIYSYLEKGILREVKTNRTVSNYICLAFGNRTGKTIINELKHLMDEIEIPA